MWEKIFGYIFWASVLCKWYQQTSGCGTSVVAYSELCQTSHVELLNRAI